MSHNFNTYTTVTRDVNNNNIYHTGTLQGYGGRGHPTPSVINNNNFKINQANCRPTYKPVMTGDPKNNSLYYASTKQGFGDRGCPPSSITNNGNYKQAEVKAKVLFGSVSTINDLKQQKTGGWQA